MNVDVVRVKSVFFFFFFFFAIFSLATSMHFFCFQNKVAHGELTAEVFLPTNTWLVCKGDEATLMILMSN